ncbi:MAG TPA: DUF2182 domain-containing protein [Spongiibacteraceae bacterium]
MSESDFAAREQNARAQREEAPLGLLMRGIARGEMTTLLALSLLAALAWGWTLQQAQRMNMPDMPEMSYGVDSSALFTFAMWAVMMIAMMLPAAAPIVLLHRRIGEHNKISERHKNEERNREQDAQPPSTALLILGYALVWSAFSALATFAQIALSLAAQITPMLVLVNKQIAGVVLIAVGIYQLTPFKQRCLTLCRSPFTFLSQHYRPGALGTLRMGITHGWFCLGCCAAAMTLLFVGGVMNPLWIAGLSAFVLVEKVLPFGRAIGSTSGAIAIIVGIYWLV